MYHACIFPISWSCLPEWCTHPARNVPLKTPYCYGFKRHWVKDEKYYRVASDTCLVIEKLDYNLAEYLCQIHFEISDFADMAVKLVSLCVNLTVLWKYWNVTSLFVIKQLECIEGVHLARHVHGDVRMDNFGVRIQQDSVNYYIFDFDLIYSFVQRPMPKEQKKHLDFISMKPIPPSGTSIYQSVNCLQCHGKCGFCLSLHGAAKHSSF